MPCYQNACKRMRGRAGRIINRHVHAHSILETAAHDAENEEQVFFSNFRTPYHR